MAVSTCYGFATGNYGTTGVLDFGKTCLEKAANLSRNADLPREVANMLLTCYGVNGAMDFGLNAPKFF